VEIAYSDCGCCCCEETDVLGIEGWRLVADLTLVMTCACHDWYADADHINLGGFEVERLVPRLLRQKNDQNSRPSYPNSSHPSRSLENASAACMSSKEIATRFKVESCQCWW
jgi:hypothetical protein